MENKQTDEKGRPITYWGGKQNKQQTAVDWLIEQLQAPCRGIPSHIIEQAKRMEKDQIKEAWNDGNFLGRNGHVLLDYSTGEQYFNETYNK